MDIKITRGDSFLAGYALFTITCVTTGGAPFDLSGWEVRTTFKPAIVAIETDPTDTGADVAIKGLLIVDGTGNPTTQNGLYLSGLATAGVLEQRLTSAQTQALPPTVALKSDLQFTFRNWDGVGNDLVRTFTFTDTLAAQDSYTNRFTG